MVIDLRDDKRTFEAVAAICVALDNVNARLEWVMFEYTVTADSIDIVYTMPGKGPVPLGLIVLGVGRGA